jgi:alginate O-acetyltransferase complex protein AlgJ
MYKCRNPASKIVRSLLPRGLALGLVVTLAPQAAEPPAGILGKGGWLFYRYELSDASDASMADESLALIQRFNRVLVANGITMALTMVPLKARIYAEHLPDSVKLNEYTAGNYERMRKLLQAAGVTVIDLNSPFLNSPKRRGDPPLFYRLDTHWSPVGAMLAADAIKAGMETQPILTRALNTVSKRKYTLAEGKYKVPSEAQDLVTQLSSNSPTFLPEQVIPFSVVRVPPADEGLLSHRRESVGITLLGSSYSRDWTGFADALRFVLQRDILSIGVGADQGSWVGMESYLRDDAFQFTAPKILIWEMPERDLRAPPDYQFRDARYRINNTEWLLRASAWVKRGCKPSTVTAKMALVSLGTKAARLKDNDVLAGPTNDNEFIEFEFDKPIGKLDYLKATVTAAGSKTMILEGSGPGVAMRRFTLNVAGDNAAHALKAPLPSSGGGFTTMRIYLGKNKSFTLHGLQICRQPEDLLT